MIFMIRGQKDYLDITCLTSFSLKKTGIELFHTENKPALHTMKMKKIFMKLCLDTTLMPQCQKYPDSTQKEKPMHAQGLQLMIFKLIQMRIQRKVAVQTT